VDVGEVKDINFILEPQGQVMRVEIAGWLNRQVNIPQDSTVWVNTLGLLGEKYIEIMPGKDFSNCLKAGQSLVGNDPIAMHEVAQLAKTIVSDIDESIVKIKNKEGTIGKLLYDDAIYKEIEASIKNREGTVGRFLYDDSIYKNLESLVADLKAHPWKLLWKPKERSEKK
jgi:phospholipid/cholesterol/gamma-HCH transport system substrate-binding protein